ncbi:hypothetical protein Pint_02489 [Pistacia integerrima]|uniref:Uncharacterized protein n=1 Tax=Pistacia integerrima TaxID=434235 RepID=A0ACC0ZQX6_9ROSI|nr:hypothetical protein Pint_02489 [Pistacia integerrima]
MAPSLQMCKLAAIRINSMAERLKFTPQIREKIYLLFQRIFTQETYLFFYRRIEQIILCCFYLVLRKVRALFPLEVFSITQNYVKETQRRSQDFCGVFVSCSSQCNWTNGENRVHIIKLYNEIFLPNVKSLLEEIGYKQVPEDHSPSSARPSLFPSVADISPKKKEALNSHVGKSYYALIGQSSSASKEVDAINECLNRRRLNTNRKRRRMLNFDDPYVTLISDAVPSK